MKRSRYERGGWAATKGRGDKGEWTRKLFQRDRPRDHERARPLPSLARAVRHAKPQ